MKKKYFQKRRVEVVVISDVHLGTYGCHARELLNYLKSIKPEKLILNGDIIDMWQFSKRYFPNDHMKVVKYILGLIAKNVNVTYIPGNHDETLRKFVGFKMGSLQIKNKLVLDHDGKKTWIFHGDVFDVIMKHSKWLAHLGAIGYDTLILINRLVNFISEKFGSGKISFSQKVKDSVKKAVSHINNFEQTAADIAIANKFEYVICGHIHNAVIKSYTTETGTTTYLNSGDWVENLTALEYNQGEWEIFRYKDEDFTHFEDENPETDHLHNNKELFQNLVEEFKTVQFH